MGISSLIGQEVEIRLSVAVDDHFRRADEQGISGRVLRWLIGADFEPHAGLPTIQAVIGSPTALEAMVNSATAMQAVAASATARSAILNSPTAMSIVGASSMAIGKLVAGIAGLNPADYADMQAVAASATAMQAVAASATALSAIAKSQTAAVAVKSAIQSYRSQVVVTLNASIGSKFTKSQVSVGTNQAGTFDHGLNTNTIYIPVQIIDTASTDTYDIYYGADTSYRIGSYQVGSSNSPLLLSAGVSIRGIRLVKTSSGSSDERLVCDVYTAI